MGKRESSKAMPGYEVDDRIEAASVTARDFLDAFHEEDLPLLQSGESASVPSEGGALKGLAEVNRHLVLVAQRRALMKTATLDVDATIVESGKRDARVAYDGTKGYQPVVVVWAEQDMIVHEEFRDGNVPAGSGNLRVIENAIGSLPEGIEEVYLRADSALYESEAMKYCEEVRAIGYAISADMGPRLRGAIAGLGEAAWRPYAEEADAVREWAEVAYVPDDGDYRKGRCTRRA